MPLPPKAAVEDHPELSQSPVSDLDGQPELDAADEPMPVELQKPVSKKKLKVVANRAGFIHQERKSAGNKFEVHEHELGSWMDCEDPFEQKKHLKRLADKKRGINLKAAAADVKERAQAEADE